MTRRSTWKLAIHVCLFAFALIVRLYARADFDGLYGQDAYAYYDFAAGLAGGEAQSPFFWPLGYPVILAGAFALVGESPQTAQLISLIMGAALSPLMYMLALEVGLKRAPAIFAGLLMAISGQAVQSSIVVMADIPALFWALISAVCLTRYTQSPRYRHWLIFAAVVLALACVTRWLYLALIPAYAVCLLIFWRGIQWRETVLCIIAAGAILIPQLVYSLTSPYPTLNHAWVQGWSFDNMGAREFVNVDGQFRYEQINAAFYAAPFYDARYLPPYFTPFIILGIFALRRGRPSHALLIGLWGLVPYIFLAGIPYQNIRFGLILLPAAILLVANGTAAMDQWLRRQPRMARIVVGVIVVYFLMVGLGTGLTEGIDLSGQFIANQTRDKQAVAWAVDQLPDDATVYTMGLTLPLRHEYTGEVRELYYETPASLNAAWVRGQSDYLLINMWQIENQWAGREPEIAMRWLRERRGLTAIGTHGYYTLFLVGGG